MNVVGDHVIEVEFSDGFRDRTDLAALFSKPPFSAIADFNHFSLTASDVLNWGITGNIGTTHKKNCITLLFIDN
ncbi:XRE family transcriptional regulator [Edwardsiella tarda]|uniref:XRE family transcriptional regulator n=1 Tax=Edwardsiella tarda TaxID=636 RepID=A0A2A7U2P7_EDWTA|nr:XRE family transcriptional regulator [Edwardsiella tarda]